MFSLFCDLGGCLGLYAGFSLITVFEFFELFAGLLWICVVRLCRRPTMATASVATVPGDKNTTNIQSPIPPTSGGLASNGQFPLLPIITSVPNDNCQSA